MIDTDRRNSSDFTRARHPADRLIGVADSMLRTLFAVPAATRPSPEAHHAHDMLTEDERISARRLMRINHTGEVCAQALYQGQALTTRNHQLRETFVKAAEEECDHLAWCDQRIKSLGGRTSVLNPIFFAGSFAIGAAAGIAGDRVSAAFLAETEHQVANHLQKHIEKLPPDDHRSKSILVQMREDELNHAKTAENINPRRLPLPVRAMMKTMSKVMTRTTFWV